MKILTARDENGTILFVESYKTIKDKKKAYCNGCNTELIFKEGKSINLDGTTRKSHFAHKNFCDCHWNNESDLHKIIKHIIFESKKLRVKDFDFNGKKQDGFDINIENPKLELYGGNMKCSFRPDICGTWNGDLIWIEAVVTHRCEENKIKYILDNDITCIEVSIDVNEFKSHNKYELEHLIGRGFELFDTKIINLKGLKKKIIEKEMSAIRTQLKYIKECANNKTFPIKTLYKNIENAQIDIQQSNLSELDKIKSFNFMRKLCKHRTSNYINYQINRDTLKSAIMLKKLLEFIPSEYENLIKIAKKYCDDKMYNRPPVLDVGIYKGKPLNKVDPLYIKFMQKTKLNIFSDKVLEYIETFEKNFIPDFFKNNQ